MTAARPGVKPAEAPESPLASRLAAVAPVDPTLRIPAGERLDSLAKPAGSLGRLEDLAARIYCIRRAQRPLRVDPARQYTLAGDHGVAAEGMGANPPGITRQMVRNFLRGGAAINVLCRNAGMDLVIVDAGCRGPAFVKHPMLLDRRIASGTANMARGPAMSLEQCAAALGMGMDLARDAARDGIVCLGVGEMGIANTTAASALLAAYLGLPVARLAGPGAGLGPGGLEHKMRVIERALRANADAVRAAEPLAVLAALGGLEIAGMAGVILGAAEAGLPCLIDGFIAQAALTAAIRLCPAASGYALTAHVSAEPGSRTLFAEYLRPLGHIPVLDLDLRLGEGTGAALALPILRAACAVFNDMATFGDAGVTRA
jgi:nicotinate-nucleotide--dimethylbenzimidazole phosphoribosyltransferase